MEISAEYIDKLKSVDPRYQSVDDGLAISTELQRGVALKKVLAAADEEAAAALLSLATVNPSDLPSIVQLQAVVYRARFIRATLHKLLVAGQEAEQSLVEDAAAQEQLRVDMDVEQLDGTHG